MENTHLEAQLAEEHKGLRLDQALAKVFPQHSRSRLTGWIKDGHVLVDGKASMKGKEKVEGTELLVVHEQTETIVEDTPIDMNLEIIYEDESILVLNKAPGIVVHPGAGNHSHTLLNGLLFHEPELANLPRAGIVHRLDKDTSGVMVVAKTLSAHTHLVAQLQDRKVKKRYLALVHGHVVAGGRIDAPVGRHPGNRVLMKVVDNGKEAISHYRLLERMGRFTLLQVDIETGRTHQIRVHLDHIQYPIVGDQSYGHRQVVPKQASREFLNALQSFKRQALHAHTLSFTHPLSGEIMEFCASQPTDLETLLQECRNYAQTVSMDYTNLASLQG